MRVTEQDKNHLMGGGAILGLLFFGSFYGGWWAILGLIAGALFGGTIAEMFDSN